MRLFLDGFLSCLKFFWIIKKRMRNRARKVEWGNKQSNIALMDMN